VLADLVARRAAGTFGGLEPVPPRREARDPVCGMAVNVEHAHHHSVYAGEDYWFCAASCRRRFDENPQEYVSR
jgi:YHS domain-containing protein